MTENAESAPPQRKVALIFTGHMIDEPDRSAPRFPAALEKRAADAIRAEVAAIGERCGGSVIGIASGARGGDILFHEVCEALGVPTLMVLPFAVDEFLERSVRGAPAGEWEARFIALWARLAARNLVVLRGGHDSDPFGACNRATLSMARKLGQTVQLLALWDGADAGKPGGTGAFVQDVRTSGGIIVQIDTLPMLRAINSRY
jgi:hypothetical protein